MLFCFRYSFVNVLLPSFATALIYYHNGSGLVKHFLAVFKIFFAFLKNFFLTARTRIFSQAGNAAAEVFSSSPSLSVNCRKENIRQTGKPPYIKTRRTVYRRILLYMCLVDNLFPLYTSVRKPVFIFRKAGRAVLSFRERQR